MRASATILWALLLTTGAAPMTTAVADEPKKNDEKKETRVTVTVKVWDARGKKFLDPSKGLEMRKIEYKGAVYFLMPGRLSGSNTSPVKGSEITEPDGTVWVVTRRSDGHTEENMVVEKKKP